MTGKTISHFEHFMTGVNWRVPVYADGTVGRPEMTSSWNKNMKGTSRHKKSSVSLDEQQEDLQQETL